MLDLDSTTHSTIHQLKQILLELPTGDSPETIQHNRKLIDWLGQPSHVIPVIRQALTNWSLLSEIASRSYRHVNLFDKIVLVGNNDPQGYRLTLHFWNPPYSEDECEEELIHEHRFNFWSIILVGTLVCENFVKADSGAAYQEYRYIPESGSRTWSFNDFYEFRQHVQLEKSEPSRKGPGASYFLSAPSIHRVVLPRTEMVCSLVLRGARLREYSNVYNTTYPTENTKFDRSMFTEAELAARLSEILNALEKRVG